MVKKGTYKEISIMAKTAGDIMTTSVITTTPEATAIEVASLLAENHISGMPVVDEEGNLVGIMTEADLPGVAPDQAFVKELMTRQVIWVTPDTLVPEVAGLMARHRIKRVPVVDEQGKVVGIVSRADVVEWIAAGA